ncbi:MAG: hypothetical protein EXX96DRAFT_640786 [Benjaminiella poitrasii]|nr:MAG: hypothetical protein EXX96DRAFT_640786 [Benjaminiella poitrasii]
MMDLASLVIEKTITQYVETILYESIIYKTVTNLGGMTTASDTVLMTDPIGFFSQLSKMMKNNQKIRKTYSLFISSYLSMPNTSEELWTKIKQEVRKTLPKKQKFIADRVKEAAKAVTTENYRGLVPTLRKFGHTELSLKFECTKKIINQLVKNVEFLVKNLEHSEIFLTELVKNLFKVLNSERKSQCISIYHMNM